MGLLDHFSLSPMQWLNSQSRKIAREIRLTEQRNQHQMLTLQAKVGARIQETLDLSLNYVDPSDAYRDPMTGDWWCPVGSARSAFSYFDPTSNEQSLRAIRDRARWFVQTNSFAINGTENRVNYVVGSTGIEYEVAIDPAKREDAKGELTDAEQEQVRDAQAIIDDFTKANRWTERQAETQRRKDRDGEAFRRLFPDDEVMYNVRFVEPDDVVTPTSHATNPAHAMGIVTDPDDVENVLGYWVNEKLIEADEIQHIKSNVDSNVRRGLSLWFPVFPWLASSTKIVTSLGAQVEIHAAIAMIRTHKNATADSVAQYVAGNADVSTTNTVTGKTTEHRQYAPGTILDGTGNTEYETPNWGGNVENDVAGLMAVLRAIASRLNMPEFMLTADASNANYASTLVAEGPAVKAFSRLQWEMIADDTEILEMVLDRAVEVGRLDEEARAKLVITAEPPQLASRDRLQEAQADQILVREEAMSVETMGTRHDLDPEHEQQKIEERKEKNQDRMDAQLGMAFGGQQPFGGGQQGQGEEDGDNE